jgi:uncharacterized protein (DUF1697 family)
VTTYVALLRGINVGGNTLIKMAELKACFEAAGMKDVTTYINSGNVIFRAAKTDPRMLEAKLEAAISKQFGFELYVVVRTYIEITDVLKHLPKSWTGDPALRCYVLFLRHTIDKKGLMNSFTPKPDIDEVHYYPGTIFWSVLMVNRTKSTMTKMMGTKLYKEMTIRNDNTLRKIHAIMLATDERA